jgi:hypothetical protein
VDWNNDGLRDLIVGESYNNGRVRIYLNAGTDANPVFNNFTYLQVGGADFMCGNQAMPEIVDWNNDGRKDILIGHTDGEIYLLINTNTDANPVFGNAVFIQNGAGDLNVGPKSSPVVCDWNYDGKKDLLVGTMDGSVYCFENKGNDASPVFNGSVLLEAGGTPINVGYYARPDVADLDGDGCRDLLVGNGDGNVVFFRSVGNSNSVLELAGYLVNDKSGNTNGFPDAGETVQLVVALSNYFKKAENVVGTLRTASPYLTILNATSSFGTIDSNSLARNSRQPFCIVVATNAPSAMCYPLQLSVYGAGCRATNHFELGLGGYTRRMASFSWEDTTTGATVVPLTDETYVYGNAMGFAFPFYGMPCTNVYISDNGFVMFDTNMVTAYENVQMPASADPDAIIAPYWDDLDPTGGVTRCKQFGVAPARYWVMEWNQVQHWASAGSYTFQLVLYEDGHIKFQYGAMSGAEAYGSSATIGIEDFSGGLGNQYSYNAAGSVSNGMAIEYVPAGGVIADANHNGLPDAYELFYFGNTNSDTNADSDGDGMSNGREFICGTDPMNAGSVLRLENMAFPAANICGITWQSIVGKPYYLQVRTNMLQGVWSNWNSSPIYGDGSGMTSRTTDVIRTGGTFYRVQTL